MDIPPFTLYEPQTAAVDRATLFPQSTRPVVDDDRLKQLDELLKANLDVDVSHARKRRKRSSSTNGQSVLHETLEPAPFNLISMKNDPKAISLGPKPLPVRTLWEPPCEDNDREAELRRQQALSAAVDVPSLSRSAQAYIRGQTRPQRAERIIRASALLPSSCPSCFLAEMPRSKPVSLRLSHDRIIQPSPHEVKSKGDALPVISLKLHKSDQPVARPRRKRRQRTVEKPPVAFWRPLRCWGGKSSGYAMGFEGSWPVEHEHELRERRYVRDQMRKAVHVIPP